MYVCKSVFPYKLKTERMNPANIGPVDEMKRQPYVIFHLEDHVKCLYICAGVFVCLRGTCMFAEVCFSGC